MRSAVLGGVPVTEDDPVFADDDGVLLAGPERRDALLDLAAEIAAAESRQAERMSAGTSLREQLDFAGYRRRQVDTGASHCGSTLSSGAARTRSDISRTPP